MEIEITKLKSLELSRFAASQAELGSDAGMITWNNAKRFCRRNPLMTSHEEIEKAKDWFREFGAWEDEEIDAWSSLYVNAVTLQYICSVLRNLDEPYRFPIFLDWGRIIGEYRRGTEMPSEIRIDSDTGRIFYDMCH